MRNTIAAAAIAMLASSGSAFAADCTKGLLWPYVRNPGDCLTEDEIKTGVYQGAPQGPVDVDNIKSPAPTQPAIPVTAQDCHETGIWPFRSEECTPIAKTSATNSAPPPPQPAVSNSSPPAPVPAATPAAPRQRQRLPSLHRPPRPQPQRQPSLHRPPPPPSRDPAPKVFCGRSCAIAVIVRHPSKKLARPIR